jgi:hypothetical protein
MQKVLSGSMRVVIFVLLVEMLVAWPLSGTGGGGKAALLPNLAVQSPALAERSGLVNLARGWRCLPMVCGRFGSISQKAGKMRGVSRSFPTVHLSANSR